MAGTERQRRIGVYLFKALIGRKNVDFGAVLGITIQAAVNAARAIEMRGKKTGDSTQS